MNLKILAILFSLFNVFAVTIYAVNKGVPDLSKNQQYLPLDIQISQFIELDFGTLQESKSIKINWIQKWIFKAAQKKLAKKVAQGKIDSTKSLFEIHAVKNDNKRGLLSLLFAGGGILFLFLGPLAYLSLPLGIAGLILGIIGVKRDKNDTMAIIGMVFGSLVILLFLLAIVLVTSFFV